MNNSEGTPGHTSFPKWPRCLLSRPRRRSAARAKKRGSHIPFELILGTPYEKQWAGKKKERASSFADLLLLSMPIMPYGKEMGPEKEKNRKKRRALRASHPFARTNFGACLVEKKQGQREKKEKSAASAASLEPRAFSGDAWSSLKAWSLVSLSLASFTWERPNAAQTPTSSCQA